MSDDLVRYRQEEVHLGGGDVEYRYVESKDGWIASYAEAKAALDAQAAEIARLRAACDDYFKTISLSQMRHGRILVGLERRNARQRRALAKLYQRRHDKNAALAAARREGMEEAAQIADSCAADWAKSAIGKYINSKWDFQSRADAGEEIAAAIRAAAGEGE